MLLNIKGLTGVVLKTALLPVAVAADVLTVGGLQTDKRTRQSYTGDLADSIGESLEDMVD